MFANASLTKAVPWWQPKPASKIEISGGRRLVGTYPICGAKNSVLPLMVAALLTSEKVTLRNAPASLDVAVLSGLLRRLGAQLEWHQVGSELSVEITAGRIHAAHIDRDLVARMRASVLLLGALLARCGEASLPLPGGDAIGRRAIDFHVAGLEAMGAEVEISDNVIYAKAPSGMTGATIRLPFPSVGATENLMMAAIGAKGTTRIENAAREPEIDDLTKCLVSMGANIGGIGTSILTIEGQPSLGSTVHEIVPDRIELGTLACAAAVTDGDLLLTNAWPDLLGGALPILRKAGIEIEAANGGVVVRRSSGGLRGVSIETGPFPGFATDLQAPVMAMLCFASGESVIKEMIFEQRFRHVGELQRMAASIEVDGDTATIQGGEVLRGAAVTGTDVRASAALVVAALGAVGKSTIEGIDHLDRGYDNMVEKLRACNADITRAFV